MARTAWPTVESIRLFGSRARGDHRERSDIDLAVSAPAATAREWDAVVEWLQDRSLTLLCTDVVRLDRAGSKLRARVAQEGVVIYLRRSRDGTEIGGESAELGSRAGPVG